MMRKNNLLIIYVMVFAFQGCATADLRSVSLKNTLEFNGLNEKGRLILQQAALRQDPADQWANFDQWQIKTVDQWRSNFIRRLTPITQADQALAFRFDLSADVAEMTYLNGRREGQVIGTESGRAYTINNGSKSFAKSRKTELYLAPVRDYFFWPQTLIDSKVVVYDGQEAVGGTTYHKIFITDGSFEADPGQDQYMVWVNHATLRIDYIEFTLRDLLRSYRGAVQYVDYRDVNGIQLPHRITLKDSVSDHKFSHQFLVEEMRMVSGEKPAAALSGIRTYSLTRY